MYPDQVRPGTKVCHYYTREWVKMGYKVIVFNMRSMFPPIYTTLAGLFPELAQKYVGNHVEMDRNMRIVESELDGVKIFSLPIFKYFPHGNYPKRSINKAQGIIETILVKNQFVPDAIVGHFHNPTAELIQGLQKAYPKAKTSVTFHITPDNVLRNYDRNTGKELFNSLSTLGFRNKTLKEQYEKAYGKFKNSFICYSGTNQSFLDYQPDDNTRFEDNPLTRFLYVGQFTHNKSIKETIEALHACYPNGGFRLNCIGDGGTALTSIETYIKENHLDQNVLLPGRMNREELIKYYDDAQVFVMISRQEAFGLVYLEAMARGCICVGTIGQGIDGVIIDGVNGFLCEGGNARKLEAIIRHINQLSYEEKLTISKNARKTAEELSEYNVAKQYIEAVMAS